MQCIVERPLKTQSEELLSSALKAPTHEPRRQPDQIPTPLLRTESTSTPSTGALSAEHDQATISSSEDQKDKAKQTPPASGALTCSQDPDNQLSRCNAATPQNLNTQSIQHNAPSEQRPLSPLGGNGANSPPSHLLGLHSIIDALPDLPVVQPSQRTPASASAEASSIQDTLSANTSQAPVSPQTSVGQHRVSLAVDSAFLDRCRESPKLFLAKPQELPVPKRMESMWNSRLSTRILADLAKITKSVVEAELRMVGEVNVDTGLVDLQPTVLIRCKSKKHREKVEKRAKELSYIHTVSGGNLRVILGAPKLASRSMPLSSRNNMVDDHSVVLPSLYLMNPAPESACGLKMIAQSAISGQSRMCTIGGLIKVGDRIYGLTTGHSVVPTALCGGSETDSESDSDTSESSEESFPVGEPARVSKSSLPFEDRPETYLHAQTHNTTKHDDTSPKGPPVSIGAYSYCAQRQPSKPGDDLAASDFALVELPEACQKLPNTYRVPFTEPSEICTVTSFQESWSDSTSNEVMIVCSQDDVRLGRLFPGPQAFVNHSTIVSTRKVEILGQPLERGVSGAWVVSGPKLLGMIVAVYDDEPYVHLLEIGTVFEDIQKLLADNHQGHQISLPYAAHRSLWEDQTTMMPADQPKKRDSMEMTPQVQNTTPTTQPASLQTETATPQLHGTIIQAERTTLQAPVIQDASGPFSPTPIDRFPQQASTADIPSSRPRIVRGFVSSSSGILLLLSVGLSIGQLIYLIGFGGLASIAVVCVSLLEVMFLYQIGYTRGLEIGAITMGIFCFALRKADAASWQLLAALLLSQVLFHVGFCFSIAQRRSGKLILVISMAMAISVYAGLLQFGSLTAQWEEIAGLFHLGLLLLTHSVAVLVGEGVAAVSDIIMILPWTMSWLSHDNADTDFSTTRRNQVPLLPVTSNDIEMGPNISRRSHHD